MRKNEIGITVIVTLSFMGGIILNQLIRLDFYGQCAGSAIFSGLFILLRRHTLLQITSLSITFLCLGSLYAHSYQFRNLDDIYYKVKYFRHQNLTVRGIIASEIKETQMIYAKKISFELDVRKIKYSHEYKKSKGKILVQIFRESDFEYGDEIEVTGKIHPPFEFSKESNFSYREYLKRRNIEYILSVKNRNPVIVLGKNTFYAVKAKAFRLRHRLIDQLAIYLTENEKGMMQAILLGERSNIPAHIRELFIRTGTAHILAISGLHVGMIALLILTLLSVMRIPRRMQLIATMILLAGYILLTGSRPSVVRAAVMYIVFLGGSLLEREANQLNMLSLAAFVLLIINPLNLFEIGFQLSFICVLGIISLAPRIRAMFYRDVKDKSRHFSLYAGLIQSFSVSVAVWLVIEGMVAYYFGIVTPVSVVANLVVVPLVMGVVYLGVGLIIFSVWFPILAAFFALTLKLALNVMVGAAFLFSQLPFAYFYWRPVNLWNVIAYYFIILMIFYIPWGIIAGNRGPNSKQHILK